MLKPAIPISKVTVIVVSDFPVARAALHCWLRNQETIEVVAEVSLDNALDQVRNFRPQVMLLHFGGGNARVLKLAQSVRREIPPTAVVAVSYVAEQAYVRTVLMAGATGYVLLRGDPKELLTAIWNASRGSSYLDPLLSDGLVHMLVQRPRRPRDDISSLPLSEREEQVLKHLALGYTHKEIADLLALSPKTVNTYRARILEKTNLRSRAEIVRYAIALGLLSVPHDNG